MTDPRLSHALGVLTVGAIVVLTWDLEFVPRFRQVRQQRQALIHLRQQVEGLELLLDEVGGEEVWGAQQQQILNALMGQLPPRSETPRVLDALLERVARTRLKLANVNQGNLEPTTDREGKPTVLDGAPCLGLPVVLTLEGTFHQIVSFLEDILNGGSRGVVSLKHLQMTLSDPTTAHLTASVGLVLHVLGP